MKKMSLVLITGLLFGTLVGCNKEDKGGSGSAGGPAVTANLATEDDKTLYAVGAMFGQRLSNFNLSANETAAVLSGMQDAITNKEKKVDVAMYQGKIQELFRKKMEESSKKEKTTGNKFIDDFIAKEKGQKTESGLAYKIIKPGTAKRAKPTDVVKVHYHGTLTDGTVFDSSVQRQKEVSFPLNRVIRGWTEGLQLIGEGGKIKLVIPSDLAYGDQGAPPKIPGGATLIFEVELFSIQSSGDDKAEDKK